VEGLEELHYAKRLLLAEPIRFHMQASKLTRLHPCSRNFPNDPLNPLDLRFELLAALFIFTSSHFYIAVCCHGTCPQ